MQKPGSETTEARNQAEKEKTHCVFDNDHKLSFDWLPVWRFLETCLLSLECHDLFQSITKTNEQKRELSERYGEILKHMKGTKAKLVEGQLANISHFCGEVGVGFEAPRAGDDEIGRELQFQH